MRPVRVSTILSGVVKSTLFYSRDDRSCPTSEHDRSSAPFRREITGSDIGYGLNKMPHEMFEGSRKIDASHFLEGTSLLGRLPPSSLASMSMLSHPRLTRKLFTRRPGYSYARRVNGHRICVQPRTRPWNVKVMRCSRFNRPFTSFPSARNNNAISPAHDRCIMADIRMQLTLVLAVESCLRRRPATCLARSILRFPLSRPLLLLTIPNVLFPRDTGVNRESQTRRIRDPLRHAARPPRRINGQ